MSASTDGEADRREQRRSYLSTSSGEAPVRRADFGSVDGKEILKRFDEGSVSLQRGHFRSARNNFRFVVDYFARGGTVIEDGEFRTAALRFLATVKLGIAHVFLGAYRTAILTLKPAIIELQAIKTTERDLESEMAQLRSEAERWLGVACVLHGDYEPAIKELQTATNELQTITGRMKPEEIPKSTSYLNLQISQDLAVASAHEGNINECHRWVRLLRKQLTDLEGLQVVETRVARLETWLAVAEVNLLLGDYRVAMVDADKAWEEHTNHFGPKHVKTFNSARLRIALLGLNSRNSEAEDFCRSSLSSMMHELGNSHPVTLETRNILGYIFRTQARLAESIDTGKAASDALAAILSDKHPKTFAARSELATKYRLVGDYRLAASIIDDEVLKPCHTRYKWQHHSTLRFVTELVHVWCSAGYLDLPEELLLRVVRLQERAYSLTKMAATHAEAESKLPQIATPSTPQTRAEGIVRPILIVIKDERLLLSSRSQIYHLKGGDSSDGAGQHVYATPAEDMGSKLNSNILADIAPSTMVVHPHLVNTLNLIAAVQLHKNEPQTNQLAVDILEELYLWNDARFGESHAYTLMMRYELAIALRETGEVRPQKALKHFEKVYELRRSKLGSKHPDTLCAQRELIMTRYIVTAENANETANQHGGGLDHDDQMRLERRTSDSEATSVSPRRNSLKQHDSNQSAKLYSEASDPSMQRSQPERQSWDIFWYQQERLGDYHPETLKTLFWIFFVQLHLKGTQGRLNDKGTLESKTFRNLLSRLRHQKVLKQRPSESKWMQNRMSEFLDSFGYTALAEEIRTYLTESDQLNDAVLEELKKQVRVRAAEILDGLQGEK
jgi:tetratricopeptide (TPR) repeat protein